METEIQNPDQRVPNGPPVDANKAEKPGSWTLKVSGNFVMWTLEQKV